MLPSMDGLAIIGMFDEGWIALQHGAGAIKFRKVNVIVTAGSKSTDPLVDLSERGHNHNRCSDSFRAESL